VEKLNISEALQKYSPVDGHGMKKYQLIAICSWMPMGIDWTQEMRDNGVDECILIGECDDGKCGDNWLTFGNAEFRDDIYLDVEESKARTPKVVAHTKLMVLREWTRRKYHCCNTLDSTQVYQAQAKQSASEGSA
jgi:hypothetical protein